MKKTLLSMAVLAASGAAFADSAMYGVKRDKQFPHENAVNNGAADHAGGPTVGTTVAQDVAKDASLIASTGTDAGSTAQMQQAGEQVKQADAKVDAPTIANKQADGSDGQRQVQQA